MVYQLHSFHFSKPIFTQQAYVMASYHLHIITLSGANIFKWTLYVCPNPVYPFSDMTLLTIYF